jgi:expansin (peptidoglycan-binding protein)
LKVPNQWHLCKEKTAGDVAYRLYENRWATTLWIRISSYKYPSTCYLGM